MNDKLKYEGKFKVGDIIKAFHFKPMEGRPDHYLIGKIIEEYTSETPYKSYKVEVLFNSTKDPSKIVYVPHETDPFDFDERITLIDNELKEFKVGIKMNAESCLRLRLQKQDLIEALSKSPVFPELEGILHLLDHIQDRMVDDGHFPEEIVFPKIPE